MTALSGALSRSVAFIAWSNFAQPGVLWLWARSLMLLAAACFVAWTAGSQACRPLRFRSTTERFVLTLSTGLAILATLATVLLLVGLYTWWAAALVGAALVAIGARSLESLPSTVRAVVVDAPGAATLALLCSMAALLPPHR